ncbi:hypothetical protein HII31_00168 [Pseudocercospora fuligena]|uniref:LysM domain-containing protein n=1 Tax=Pseudocercospora fuligena TaxID=685502 RepID=A0A8H6RVW2_9PEZI|nr:hypothetical protein HII31_00168 [Pseudocercospora fuligena]
MSASASSNATASTLRPRTNRLISGLSDDGDSTIHAPSARIASPVPSPYTSRTASPIPSAHPQRTSPQSRRHDTYTSGGSPVKAAAGRQRRAGGDSGTSLSGLWGNSWSALQGIASDLLGSDLNANSSNSKVRPRRSGKGLNGLRPPTSASPNQWGPSAPTSNPRSGAIGAGTSEEQVAAFRAQKRKDMLTGQETSYADALGKFKRRLSDDRNSASAPPGEAEDRDALVYLHPVKKDDTLAGITIRYNVSANVLRKANRMWPNDTPQARKVLILPVDACAVKGKPVSDAELDLLGSESEALSTLQAEEVPTPTATTYQQNGIKGQNRDRTNSTSTHTSTSAAASTIETEPNWQHDSWVLLPGNKDPTEIARLPRRALGYFPPARRKSNSYSDLDTPSTSLEIFRSNTEEIFSAMGTSSSPRGSSLQRPRGGRRLSNATNGYFPAYLQGPGGVGTMDRNVRFPGPAQDGLNKLMAKHLPDVAPPRNQASLYHPDVPMYSDDPTPVASGAQTPAYPHGNGGGMNLENVGGAIESWVRRLATKAAHTPTGRVTAARASVGTPGRGAGGIGDLIEMTDEFEIGNDEEEEERGRQGSGQAASELRPGTTATSYFDGAIARSRSAKAGKSWKDD